MPKWSQVQASEESVDIVTLWEYLESDVFVTIGQER